MYHVSAQGVDERVIMNSIGSICRLRMVVLSIFMQQKHFFPLSLSSSGCIHAGSFLTSEEKKVGL